MVDKPEDKTTEKQAEESTEEALPASGIDPKRFGRFIWVFLLRTLSIREGVDVEATTEGIRKDIDFKGPNVWILIASILIASIGLNVNSTAVVIGAMLISPLMGPILGIGLATGTNDWKMLIRSLRSLGVAVGVSLLTSTIYFAVSPFGEAQSELLARTQPQLLDVLIAFFGGVAGIVAGSRKEKTNAIPGVAIATALMPPLCTAGYGLATGHWPYLFGALYLFLINSVFIATSTFLIVRYLRFPLVHFVDPKKEKRFRTYLIIFIIAVIGPSLVTTFFIAKDSAYKLRKQNFETRAQAFVDEQVSFKDANIMVKNYEYSDTASKIEIYVLGEHVPETKESELNAKLGSYGLINTRLYIRQYDQNENNLSGPELMSRLEESYRNREDLAKTKDEIIRQRDTVITNLLVQLKGYESHEINFKGISEEVKIQYPDAEKFGYALSYETDANGTIDTIPTVMVQWRNGMTSTQRSDAKTKMEKWLKLRLNVDTLRVMNY